MSVVTSFRVVYLTSRVFGIFPYETTSTREFRLGKLRQGQCILALVFLIRMIIVSLDVKYNLYSTARKIMTIFRALNTSWLHVLTIVIYRNVLSYSQPTCDWLNKMSKLYSSLQGDPHSVSLSNRLIVAYSVVFFLAANSLALVGFLLNAKFINGWISMSDSMCFAFLLLIENLYLCQFITYMRLVELSFERINEILRSERLQRERGMALLKKLKILRKHHLTLTEFFEFLQTAFQFNLLLYICWAFISTVFCCISVVLFDINDAITFLLWMSYHPFQNFPIVYLCESVSSKSKTSIYLVNEFLIHNDAQEIKEEAEIFSLQLQHRPTDFIVCGFFQLDFKVVHSATAIVTTYIIALLQIQPDYIPSRNVTDI